MRKSNSGTNPKQQGGRQRMPAGERRRQILETALPVFALQGFAATGTRDLAKAAGVSEPILYRHFTDKPALFAAVLEVATDEIIERLDASLPDGRGASARLRALSEGLPDLLESLRMELRVLSAAALVEGHPALTKAAGASWRRVGLALGAGLRGSGLRRGVDSTTAGFLLLQVGVGAAIVRPLPIPEMEGDVYRRKSLAILLRGLTN